MIVWRYDKGLLICMCIHWLPRGLPRRFGDKRQVTLLQNCKKCDDNCSGWVPCFICFPAFRGHVTLFSCLLIHFSECLQLGHSLKVTTQNWSVSTHWRLYCLEHCLRVLSRFKIVAVLAVLEIKVRELEWISSLQQSCARTMTADRNRKKSNNLQQQQSTFNFNKATAF